MRLQWRAATNSVAALLFRRFLQIFGWLFCISCCGADPSPNLETLIWLLPRPALRDDLDRWLTLTPVPAFSLTGQLQYHPFYYRWTGSHEDRAAAYWAPQTMLSWRGRKEPLSGGVIYSESQSFISVEMPLSSYPSSLMRCGRWQRRLSGFLEGALRYPFASRWVLGTGIENDLGGVSPWWAGGAFYPHSGWCLSVQHQVKSQQLYAHLLYADEDIELYSTLQGIGDRAGVRGSVSRWISLEADYGSYALRDARYDPGLVDYELTTHGVFNDQRYELQFHLTRNLDLMLAHGQNYLNSQGYFYHNEMTFGKVTREDFFLSRFDAGLIHRFSEDFTLQFMGRYVQLDGRLKGHVESWPFTPTLIDLLGLRRYFDGQIEAQLRGGQLQMDRRLNSQFRAELGLLVWQVLPQGTFSSWQPLFWGIGKTDEQTMDLTLKEAWVGGVSIGGEYQYQNWRFNLRLRQLFPIEVKYHSLPSEPSGPPVSPPRQYGGGFFGCSVSYAL